MQRKPLFWVLAGLLCLGGVIFYWHLSSENGPQAIVARGNSRPAPSQTAAPSVASNNNPTNKPAASTASPSKAIAQIGKPVDKRYPYRISNTTKSSKELVRDPHAVLMMNALVDTTKPLTGIPDDLKARPDGGSYIVQAAGPPDAQFRAVLKNAGAAIVSYIPNDAYLVRVSASGAQQILDNGAQSVTPFEPYYKLEPSLLKEAIEQPDALPPEVNVTVFADALPQTLANLAALGAVVQAQDRSPFGPLLKVQPAEGTLAAMASLPGVQALEPVRTRKLANDLDRVRLNVAVDEITNVNYLGLSGENVLVNINDTGVDATHPDFAQNRIAGDDPSVLVDFNGHGTHVAGTILGNGSESSTVTNAQGSVTNANFRGMATNATAFVMRFDGHPDSYLQEQAAKTNAYISNNSWNYGDAAYDIASASYDAAVRDALPEVTGPQPLVYVFAAGDVGGGADDGSGGLPDSILSPATAKNVITVGAIEEPRFITNEVVVDGVTNNEIFNATDSDDQVWSGSSRGNVGVNVEGDFGRFKPDLVAPGTFIISDRSQEWDTNAYYNPTFTEDFFQTNEVVGSNSFTGFLFPVPPGATQIDITLITNQFSLGSLPSLSIYGAANQNATTNASDFLGTNSITLNGSTTPSVNPGDTLFFDIQNNTLQSASFDIQIQVTGTNDVGNFFSVLFDLNSQLGPFYRYESGTSMSAAGISGMLALMQEFFQTNFNMRPSPALMKALLINGSRSVSDQYNFQTTGSAFPTSQGWGLPSLPDVISTNMVEGDGSGQPQIQFYEQSPTNVLATGQSFTRKITLTTNGANQDLRITLVWTDPPGNPTAGVKLVNDLDLIVTNLDATNGTEVFYGNNFQADIPYSEAFSTNNGTGPDSINNVENVYLQGPLDGQHYSVTVLGRRVNVNAVTENTNDIVQDFALVVSSGDAGGATNAFSIQPILGVPVTNAVSNLVVMSNAVPLLNQRVGANSQFSGSTNGTAAQWDFYIFTNTLAATNANFTNVAFVTFLPPNLSVPRMGASGEIAPPDINATRFAGADIDLYVSTDPTLTNLNPAAIAAAQKSVTRTGDETVFFTNSTPNQVFYVGVKSEDQEGGQFNLIGFATDIPFSQQNANGDVTVNMNSVPLTLPNGIATKPGSAFLIGIVIQPVQVRNVIVTNTVTAQDFGDYIGSLSEGTRAAILNNHSFFTNRNDARETLVYDDSGATPGALKSAGPGTLQNFVGINALGTAWTYTIVNDSSQSDTGTINSMSLFLQHQPPAGSRFEATISGDSFFFGFVDVPVDATNLTISVSDITGAQPIDVYVKQGEFPSTTSFDYFAAFATGSGSLSINKFSSPPLNAGRYFYGIFNPSPTAQTVDILAQLGISLTPVTPLNFLSRGNEPILDDAVTDSTNHVGESGAVVSAEVGVRIQHPRESDLVLTLISPEGTRVLLAENRGGQDTNGYGAGVNITNTAPTTTSGTQQSETNILDTGNTFGTLLINYDFFNLPDDMRIYYDGQRIFDSGLIPGTGTFSVNYGPGLSTNVEIVMNQPGTNPSTNGDLWNYTVSVITQEITYATFTEDTNKTTTPIKFAIPPFGSGTAFLPPVPIFSSGFEGVAAGSYSNDTVDGWTVPTSNAVTVVTVPFLTTDGGTNVLALHTGTITRTFPTIPGKNYTLRFVNHGPPSALGPVGWWKGENNYDDSSGFGNNMVSFGTFNPAPPVGFAPGEVGQAFDFVGNQKLRVDDQPIYNLTNALSIEAWIDPVVVADGQVVFFRGDNAPGLDPYTMAVNLPRTTTGAPLELDFGITDQNGNGVAAAAPIQPNVLQHVAGTYSFDGTNGLLSLYVNGLLMNQVPTTAQPLAPLTAGGAGLGIGNVGDTINNFGFNGLIDEMTLHSNTLSGAQVDDIYAAAYLGKAPVGTTPLVRATVAFDGETNAITGLDQWTTNVYSFVATGTTTTLTISPETNSLGVEDGMLLDSFLLVQDAVANPTNFFLPEESLDKIVGESSQGDWKLEILDNRAGPPNAAPELVSWQLSLVLADKVPQAVPLTEGIPQTNTVAPDSIVYYFVDVPPWASFATNILTVTSGGPLNLLFNQTGEPTGTNATDFTLIGNEGVGTQSSTLSLPGSPPLVPGQRYFLGVQNTSLTTPATFNIQVDFNITTLTNAIPDSNQVAVVGGIPRYFQFDVDSNVAEVVFDVSTTNPADLEMVVSKGPPLPDETTFDYVSALPASTNQVITVQSNSTPVPLAPGRWFIGVFNSDPNPVTYTIVATEFAMPTIIPLVNGVPFTFNAGPGPDLTNFFVFTVPTNTPAVLFQLYNLSGNVDLTLDQGSLPFSPPFLAQSTNPGTNAEQIVLRTNIADVATLITNNLAATNWFLGVPNNTTGNVTYTIRAVISTNGILTSGTPFTLGASAGSGGGGPVLTWAAVLGESYALQLSTNLVTWTTVSTNVASGTTISIPDPVSFSTDPTQFFRIVQIPTP